MSYGISTPTADGITQILSQPFGLGPSYRTSRHPVELGRMYPGDILLACPNSTLLPSKTYPYKRLRPEAYWIPANNFVSIPTFGSNCVITDRATGRTILSNPEQGPSTVLYSPVDPDFPFTQVETPSSLILLANGIDPVLKWDPLTQNTVTAGVIAPTSPLVLGATPFVNRDAQGNLIADPSYWAFYRYKDSWGNYSSFSPISNTAAGGVPFTYTGIIPPTEAKVVSIQLFRNTSGQASVYYLDGEITNFEQTAYISYLTDDDLSLNLPYAITSTSGQSFLNLHNVPPSHKSCLEFQVGRAFMAVDVEYRRGNARVTFQSTTVYGVDTQWKSNFVGRAFYVVGAPSYYVIVAVNVTNQTITLDSVYAGVTNEFGEYTIRPLPSERRLVYYSEADLPESWPPTNSIQVHEDGDELTGLVAFNSFLYIVEKRHTYRFTYQNDPAVDGFVFSSTNRGCVSQRCIVRVEDSAWMLDEQGIHKFSGGAAEPVSEPVQDLFQVGQLEGLSINWGSDTRLWHAAWDPEWELIRWFVAFGTDPEPRDAICYQYRLNRFWVENYERPITSSTQGILSTWRSLVGSTARQILCLSQGTLDGIKEDPKNTQGSIVSAEPTSFTVDTGVYLPSSLINMTVGVMAGRGVGQIRIIVKIVGAKVYIDRPWEKVPDSTSVYQFGSFKYNYQTGWFRFTDDEAANSRDVEIIHAPTKYQTYFNVGLFYNFEDNPRQPVIDRKMDNVTYSSTNPWVSVYMTGFGGRARLRQEGHGDVFISDQYTGIGLTGVSSVESVRIRQITIDGCEQ